MIFNKLKPDYEAITHTACSDRPYVLPVVHVFCGIKILCLWIALWIMIEHYQTAY